MSSKQCDPAGEAHPPAKPSSAVPIQLYRNTKNQSVEMAAEAPRFRPLVYWYLSFRCNLACQHCSVKSSPWVDTSTDLQTDDALRVIDQLAELDVSSVVLTGGEMLARRDALPIIEQLGNRGIPTFLESNGVLITEKFARLAKSLQDRRLLEVGISLDGGTAETHNEMRGAGTFAATVRGMRLLHAHGVRFVVQMILNRHNYSTIPALFALGRELWPMVSTLSFGLLNPIGRGTELTKTLGLRAADVNAICGILKREQPSFEGFTVFKGPPAVVPPQHLDLIIRRRRMISHMSCAFPLLGVLPDGSVTICALSRDNPSLYFGNVRTHSLKRIWADTRMTMLRSRYVAAESLQGICADCVWKYSCKGSCRAWAYEDGADFDAPFPICTQMQAAGEFPRAYRISAREEAMSRWLAQHGGDVSCGCSA